MKKYRIYYKNPYYLSQRRVLLWLWDTFGKYKDTKEEAQEQIEKEKADVLAYKHDRSTDKVIKYL